MAFNNHKKIYLYFRYLSFFHKQLFGWISAIILTASLWFIYKDTIVHQDRMGPLYQLPFFSKKNSAKTPEEAYDPSRSTYTPSKQKEDENDESQDENDESQDEELTVEVHPESKSVIIVNLKDL